MANNALGFPFGFFTNDNLPQDAKYFSQINKAPYASVAACNAELLQAIRYRGLTVNIAGVEYWYKDGVTDVDLVIKVTNSLEVIQYNNDIDDTDTVNLTFAKENSVVFLNGEFIGATDGGFTIKLNATLNQHQIAIRNLLGGSIFYDVVNVVDESNNVVAEFFGSSKRYDEGDTILFSFKAGIGWVYMGTFSIDKSATKAEVNAKPNLGETSSTAYRGDRGKTAYDHSQITNSNPHATTTNQISETGDKLFVSASEKSTWNAKQNAVAVSTDAQMQAGIDDSTRVTPLKVANWWTWIKTQAQSIGGIWEFLNILRIKQTTAIQEFIETTGNKTGRVVRSATEFYTDDQVLQVGGIGKAIRFNGTAQQGTFSGTGLPTAGSSLTIAFWVRPDQIGNIRQIFCSSTPQTANNLGIIINNSSQIQIFNLTGGGVNTTGTVSTTSFNLVVVTINGGTVQLSLNNSVYQSFGGATGASFGSPQLGGYTATQMDGVSGSTRFSGLIDQFLIYNRVISQSEVNTIWNGGNGTSSIPTTGLLMRLEFEEGTGTSVADLTGNGRNMTLTGGVGWDNNGAVPVAGSTSVGRLITSKDGLTNSERGIQEFGEFNGRNRQQGKWFQWFQNNITPFVSDNFGRFRMDLNRTAETLPTIGSNFETNNQSVGAGFFGLPAPTNGQMVQGRQLIGTSVDNLTDRLQVAGDAYVTGKLKIETGSNASVGFATLVAGTVTVNTTAVTANSGIVITVQQAGQHNGRLRVTAKNGGTSFTVTSSDNTDNCQFFYQIIN